MSTYKKGINSINGYHSHWKSVSRYIKCKHRSTAMSLTGSVSTYKKVNQGSTAISHCISLSTYNKGKHSSMAIILTGNQCPHITRGTTISMAISLNGNQCPYITKESKHKRQSISLEISVHIYLIQTQHQRMSLTGYVCTYERATRASMAIIPSEISVYVYQG